jgi:DNA-binding SARP family transcriptional activator
MYWCRTLGELALYADSAQAVPLVRAGKSLAILAYLGLSPRRSECRDRIAQLFWPDASLSQAHHTLRQLLYRLRQAVPDEPLLNLEGNSLVLSAEVKLDALAGEQALEAGDVESAFALLGGTFLEGFSIAESAELEEWIESQRARFRECFARAGEALVERKIAEGRPQQAVTVAEEVKAANPLDESRARLLIETLDSIGQTRRALAEYESYATLLRAALEDEPSPELQTYARELENSIGHGSKNGATVLPFVGRSQAWARLLQELTAAQSGGCSLVLVEGDAGLGKTRLVEEFAARARASASRWSRRCRMP